VWAVKNPGLTTVVAYAVFVPSRHRRVGRKFVISDLSLVIDHLKEGMKYSHHVVIVAGKQNLRQTIRRMNSMINDK